MTTNRAFNLSTAAAYDAQNLEQLKAQAKREPDKAVGAAAKQFESLFVGMMLKSMREATPQDGMFDNEQSRLYTSMLDQQLAQHVASRGIGLAAALTRQLSSSAAAGTAPNPDALIMQLGPLPSLSTSTLAPQTAKIVVDQLPASDPPAEDEHTDDAMTPHMLAAPAVPSTPATGPLPLEQTREFVNRVWTHAVDAARAIGIPPRFMVGQAALESGWGKHEIRAADGTSSHNVFGIKAGRTWKGPVVEKTTTEYVNGVAQKVTAKFRAYSSYSEAFQDYAKLLRGNPRYASVLGQAQDAKGFAHSLQKSGYATDPAYADKLTRIINGSTLRQSLIG
jgi:flagellar protein FlgJ